MPRPALGSDRERLLSGVLGKVEIAEEADQESKDTTPLVAKDPLDQDDGSMIGRISTEPPRRRTGIRLAIPSTTSTSSTSKT